MTFEEMAEAIASARCTLKTADEHVAEMARIVSGRLRKSSVSAYVLSRLKNELRDFNIHTGRWK